MTPALTRKQRRALAAIEKHIAEHGHAPTLRALAATLNIGIANAHRYVAELERRGAIARDPGRHNAISIVRSTNLDFLPPDVEIQVQELAVLARARPEDVLAEAARDGIALFHERSRNRAKSSINPASDVPREASVVSA